MKFSSSFHVLLFGNLAVGEAAWFQMVASLEVRKACVVGKVGREMSSCSSPLRDASKGRADTL